MQSHSQGSEKHAITPSILREELPIKQAYFAGPAEEE